MDLEKRRDHAGRIEPQIAMRFLRLNHHRPRMNQPPLDVERQFLGRRRR